MLVVGFGKQRGANSMHNIAVSEGYISTIESMLQVILQEVSIIGGIAIVENFMDRTARVEAIPTTNLPDGENELLRESRKQMATLPTDG